MLTLRLVTATALVVRTKAYGFIQPDIGSKDVFFHISAVEKVGLSNSPKAQR